MGTTSLRRDDILKVLRENRAMLDAYGVARLSVFGSVARDEACEGSDIDLLVEFNRAVGLFEIGSGRDAGRRWRQILGEAAKSS